MKKLTILIYFLLASILLVSAADKKVSEFSSRTNLVFTDIFPVVSTNGSGGFTNFSINYSNLWFNIRQSIGGVITNNVGATSNSVTANITNLLTVSIATNFLDSDGDIIKFTSGGTFANSTQAKSLYVLFGATTLAYNTNILFTTGNTNSWRIEGEIVRKGSASYVASTTIMPSSLHSYSAGGTTNYTYTATIRGADSLTVANTLAIQTRGISQGDVTNEFLQVINLPQP